jgi:hypothetical protein
MQSSRTHALPPSHAAAQQTSDGAAVYDRDPVTLFSLRWTAATICASRDPDEDAGRTAAPPLTARNTSEPVWWSAFETRLRAEMKSASDSSSWPVLTNDLEGRRENNNGGGKGGKGNGKGRE